MSNAKQTLLTALLTLHAAVQAGAQRACGICDNVGMAELWADEWRSANQELKRIFARWPEYSGLSHLPIPGEYCWGAHVCASRLAYLWGEGEYGQARRRLLDFCIAELQRELAPPITSKSYKPAHGGYPDANHDAIKATTPTTCCPCGQVPVCHGLRSCGKSRA